MPTRPNPDQGRKEPRALIRSCRIRFETGSFAGGTASNDLVESAGYDIVFSGGADSNATIQAGGYLHVFRGGTETTPTVDSGARVTLYAGAILSDPVLQPGAYVDFGGIAYAPGGTATPGNATDVLTFNEAGVTTPVQHVGNSAGDSFILYSDFGITNPGSLHPGTDLTIAQTAGAPIPQPATLTLIAISALLLARLRVWARRGLG